MERQRISALTLSSGGDSLISLTEQEVPSVLQLAETGGKKVFFKSDVCCLISVGRIRRCKYRAICSALGPVSGDAFASVVFFVKCLSLCGFPLGQRPIVGTGQSPTTGY